MLAPFKCNCTYLYSFYTIMQINLHQNICFWRKKRRSQRASLFSLSLVLCQSVFYFLIDIRYMKKNICLFNHPKPSQLKNLYTLLKDQNKLLVLNSRLTRGPKEISALAWSHVIQTRLHTFSNDFSIYWDPTGWLEHMLRQLDLIQ